jgi:hypothetical protein
MLPCLNKKHFGVCYVLYIYIYIYMSDYNSYPYITCREPPGVCAFPRIPQVGMQCCMYFWRGVWSTFLQPLCLLGLQYVETYFRIIIMMKRGMSFSFYNFINSLIRVVLRTQSAFGLLLQNRNNLYIWRYILLCVQLMANKIFYNYFFELICKKKNAHLYKLTVNWLHNQIITEIIWLFFQIMSV